MKCMYPENSRMYKACMLCEKKYMCDDYAINLPSAQEAYDETNKSIINNATEELKHISKYIKEAIADGKYYISHDGVLSNAAKQELEKNHYKVETGYQYNESYYTIYWNRPKTR